MIYREQSLMNYPSCTRNGTDEKSYGDQWSIRILYQRI